MGSLLEKILITHPKVRGIHFDQMDAVQLARPRFESAGLLDRCDFVDGSFLESIPRGADACILKHVLRDWDDERAHKILRNCHHALEPGGTLLIVEAVLNPRNGTDRIVKLVDLEMSSLSSGGFRTAGQLRSLIEATGFRWIRVHPTAVPDCQILEVRKVAVPVPTAHFHLQPSAAVTATTEERV